MLSTRTVRTALVPTWPEPSVAIARRSYWPSLTVVVSKEAVNGAPVFVAIVVQPPPPCGARWKSTRVVSASELADRPTVPCRFAPGSASAGVGATLSTVTVRDEDVVVLPAMSVTTTSSVAWPSPCAVVFQEVVKGGELFVVSVFPSTRKTTEEIGFASVATAETVTLPETSVPAPGEPTAAPGAVLSTTFESRYVIDQLPALSLMAMRRS